ncbi:MauE/DoxX family redox-associated membrane protein [Sphingobacterium sp.]|uniref:MauE/DoxX family redox-associated membrane protein n=1 Tax=Sphingobacterium sp. TaxID=341027 RepID=UPI0028AAD631|nr:MauE/DoxX family redox-associated membrane protein [Sphingobacterium sp.]
MKQPSHRDPHRGRGPMTGNGPWVRTKPLRHRNPLWAVPRAITLFYVFLFTYTGYSKLNDLDSFAKGISKVPFLGQYARAVAWGVPLAEILLAIGMVLPLAKVREVSMKLSVALMWAFTVYLFLMITLVKEKLCNCGGIIGSLGWHEHLLFNIAVSMLGVWSIRQSN